jgi:uncharacterized protein (UPF0335 family)
MTNNQLKEIVERIERIEDQRASLAEDVKDVLLEAKSVGFDVKIIKKLLAMRKKDPEDIRQEQELLDTYMAALGMLADTPLGQAALERLK